MAEKTYTREEIKKAFLKADRGAGFASLTGLLSNLNPDEWTPFDGEVVYDGFGSEMYIIFDEKQHDIKGLEPLPLSRTRFTPMLEIIRKIARNDEPFPDNLCRRFLELNQKSLGILPGHFKGEDI